MYDPSIFTKDKRNYENPRIIEIKRDITKKTMREKEHRQFSVAEPRRFRAAPPLPPPPHSLPNPPYSGIEVLHSLPRIPHPHPHLPTLHSPVTSRRDQAARAWKLPQYATGVEMAHDTRVGATARAWLDAHSSLSRFACAAQQDF